MPWARFTSQHHDPGADVTDVPSKPDPDDYAPLDAAFQLPPEPEAGKPGGVHIPADLRELFEFLVARMRSEAKHLPHFTTMQLIIERIATNYIMVKVMERYPVGSEGGYPTPVAQKDWNTFVLAVIREFNEMLIKIRPGDDEQRRFEELRKQLGREVINVVRRHVKDPTLVDAMRGDLAMSLDRVGL